MNAIDLFCGCGGASLGLRMAGFEVVAAIDNNPSACVAYTRNLGLTAICSDLRFFDGAQILDSCGLKRGDIDLVVGCPPCQGFSSLRRTRHAYGYGSGKNLVTVFLERITEIRPRAVILENVPGLAKKGGLRYLRSFMTRMEKMGYKISYEQFSAADFGVPQFRKRLIVLCVQGSVIPEFPAKTHSNPKNPDGNLKPWQTVKDAIGDLPRLEQGEKCKSIPNHYARKHSIRITELIKRIPKDGGSRASLPLEYWLPCHLRLESKRGGGAESVYGRLSWKKPAPTITCRCTTPSCGRFLHPEQDRAISPREAARIQCFPDDFIFPEGFQPTERLIGNAVPPLLMSIQSKSLKEIL